jgi:hypothetical protein
MYSINIAIVISIIILLILLLVGVFKNNEGFENRTTIGFLIPTTSKNRNYKIPLDSDFFKILLTSIKKTNLNPKYNYIFYLGFDDDDYFYNTHYNDIINVFNKLNIKNSKIKLIKIHNKKGKVGQIWSYLAAIAYNTCDYFYQLGDDINILTSGWEDSFINKLRESNNIGVVGPNDINYNRILTQSFVHKTHLDIFGYYFPTEIVNWYIDDWITEVYSPKYMTKFNNINVNNSGGPPRYNITHNREIYIKCVSRDKIKLNNYIINHS